MAYDILFGFELGNFRHLPTKRDGGGAEAKLTFTAHPDVCYDNTVIIIYDVEITRSLAHMFDASKLAVSVHQAQSITLKTTLTQLITCVTELSIS